MQPQPLKPSRDPYARAASIWIWAGVMFFAWPILADIARPHGIGELREAGTLWAMFMAIAAVIVLASARDDSARSRWMSIAAGLSAAAAAVAEMAQLHIAWQGRVLGYAFLLFASARFGPGIRGMSDRAPEPLVARMRWYVRLLGLQVLTIAMVTSAWSLAMPTRLGGDLAHLPARGLVMLIVWPTALLGAGLVGWPATKRLIRGGFSPLTADEKSRLVMSGVGLLLIAAGVRGAVVGPNQPHPASAELAAAILIWLGFWIERRVLRKALGVSSAQ